MLFSAYLTLAFWQSKLCGMEYGRFSGQITQHCVYLLLKLLVFLLSIL